MPSLCDAQLRHARHYQALLSSADRLYLQGGDATVRALALFDLEWPNVQVGQQWAAAQAGHNKFAAQLCSAYALSGTQCSSLRVSARALYEWAEAALAAAQQAGDRHAEAAHLGSLGAACAALGRHDQAFERYKQALALARASDVNDRRAQGNALAYLGAHYMNAGQPQQAIEFFQQWLSTAGNFDRRDEGTALMNLGVAYLHLSETALALNHLAQALAIARETGNLRREGDVYENLAVAYGRSGDYRLAVECLDQAAAIARKIGDGPGEGGVLCNLGVAYAHMRDYPRAIASVRAALVIVERIDHPLWRHAMALLSQ
jgi:tetratricopeptide (TPR) repeat protein